MRIARHWLIAVLICFNIALPAWGTEEAEIFGRYWNPDRDGIVEVYREGDRVQGRVIWSATALIDAKNRDKTLRGRDMLGVPFLTGFRFDGDDRWTGGLVYAPDNGRTYRGRLWLEDGNLKMRGFVGISALGRTATFLRYDGGTNLPDGGYLFAPATSQKVEQE